ncbi:class I SAM-dependent methyltransferase [Lysobacter sp. Root690]|uniref:class I SAM-dependent methyltransferase n=1 Tax=Lysobacter sp. Root690 TaxID=1736588 RepID=UPI0006FD6238|nr:class I SAM-dependent methyltransferase [Lysobacter sp. Root690]KRB03345.1 16S rRNA methyltransferase [Lysobacter sp. Root690]
MPSPMRVDASDDALDTLFQPFADGVLSWPDEGGALFLRARDGVGLRQRPRPGLVCEQDYKPAIDALHRGGLDTVDLDSMPADRRYPLVLVLPPRQRDEARALYAQALARTAPGGRVVACLSNDEGARSGEDDLGRIAGKVGSLSKRKCRVFWTAPLDGPADPALAAAWAGGDRPREILGGRFLSRPGVFAWDRVDPASALLAEHLPADLAGRAADLGAGYGYLSAELLARCPRITALDVYEAQARALQLARTNLQRVPTSVPMEFFWHDVTAGLDDRGYDVIVSNPPFHAQGREERPDIGRRFIAVAAQALNPGGRLWLVANRHLPYEVVLDERFGEVRTVAQQGGFKVVEAIKAKAAGKSAGVATGKPAGKFTGKPGGKGGARA